MRKLTEKEKQILEYLAEGFSNKEIAPGSASASRR